MNDRAAPSLVGTRPTQVRYVVLAWICALSMITYIDRVCIKQVAGDMQRDLGLSAAQFAWVFSAFALSYALLEVPSGWLGDWLGPRKVLARIVLCWSVFTALTGCVWSFTLDSGYRFTWPWLEFNVFPLLDGSSSTDLPWVQLTSIEVPLLFNGFLLLLLIRFLFGAGEAGAYPNSARALRNWFPYTERGRAQGLLWTFGRWGGAVAPILITVIALRFGWRGAFVVFALMGVVWVIGFYTWFRDMPRDMPQVNEAELHLIEEGLGKAGDPVAPLSWSTMLRSRTLWVLCLMYFSSNAGWCFFITWDVKYYETVLGMTGWPLAIASGSPLFFGGIACLLGGLLTDRQVRVWGPRWGRTLQGLVAYAFGGLLFLAALLTTNPYLAVGALCLASFGKDFAMACSWSTCIDIGHRYSGTVAGFMNMVGNFGTVVSPPIVAWMAGRGNWSAALVYSAIMFFIAAACWAFINPRRVIVYKAA